MQIPIDHPILEAFQHDEQKKRAILQERFFRYEFVKKEASKEKDGEKKVWEYFENFVYECEPAPLPSDRYGIYSPVAPWDQEKENEFLVLWSRAWDSEKFATYRCGVTKQTRSEEKWPREQQLALFRAAVLWRPRYRKKVPGSRKLLGRNESLVEALQEWTAYRCFADVEEGKKRKKLSTHLQTINKHFADNPYVKNYFSGDWGVHGNTPRSGSHRAATRSRRQTTARRMESTNTRQALECALPTAPVLKTQAPRAKARLLEFQMYSSLRRRGAEGSSSVLHSYTKLQKKHSMPDLLMTESSTWQKAYPQLALMHKEQDVDCDVILAEAALKLPRAGRKEPSDMELVFTIEGLIATPDPLDRSLAWYCRTTFYEPGARDNETFLQRIAFEGENEDKSYRYSLPFASKYWAQKFSDMANPEQVTSERGDQEMPETDPEKAMKERLDKAKRHMRATVAVQEILGFPPNNPDDKANTKRAVIISWKFRLTNVSEAGYTMSRSLVKSAAASPSPDAREMDMSPQNDNAIVSPNDARLTSSFGPFQSNLDTLASTAIFGSSFADFNAFPNFFTAQRTSDSTSTSFEQALHAVAGAEAYSSADFSNAMPYNLSGPEDASMDPMNPDATTVYEHGPASTTTPTASALNMNSVRAACQKYHLHTHAHDLQLFDQHAESDHSYIYDQYNLPAASHPVSSYPTPSYSATPEPPHNSTQAMGSYVFTYPPQPHLQFSKPQYQQQYHDTQSAAYTPYAHSTGVFDDIAAYETQHSQAQAQSQEYYYAFESAGEQAHGDDAAGAAEEMLFSQVPVYDPSFFEAGPAVAMEEDEASGGVDADAVGLLGPLEGE